MRFRRQSPKSYFHLMIDFSIEFVISFAMNVYPHAVHLNGCQYLNHYFDQNHRLHIDKRFILAYNFLIHFRSIYVHIIIEISFYCYFFLTCQLFRFVSFCWLFMFGFNNFTHTSQKNSLYKLNLNCSMELFVKINVKNNSPNHWKKNQFE